MFFSEGRRARVSSHLNDAAPKSCRSQSMSLDLPTMAQTRSRLAPLRFTAYRDSHCSDITSSRAFKWEWLEYYYYLILQGAKHWVETPCKKTNINA